MSRIRSSLSWGALFIALTGVSAAASAAGTFAVSMEASSVAQGADTTATLTASEVFVNLPVDVLDMLKRNTRLDMLDYMGADSVWVAPNAFQGTSQLVSVSPDFLEVRLTEVSDLKIKILPTPKGKMAMTIYTVGAPEKGADSDIRFFDAALKPLPTEKYFRVPDLKYFLDLPKGTKDKEVLSHLPFPTILLDIAPGSDTLTGRLTLGPHMPCEDAEAIQPYIRPAVTWTWTGKDFRLDKK